GRGDADVRVHRPHAPLLFHGTARRRRRRVSRHQRDAVLAANAEHGAAALGRLHRVLHLIDPSLEGWGAPRDAGGGKNTSSIFPKGCVRGDDKCSADFRMVLHDAAAGESLSGAIG
ncbi:unnamed protein product, partial [Scytosiphon promiscuus]